MRIYTGVLCRVIGGTDNLNIGKIVRVASLQGEHSVYGRIWRCTTEGELLVTEFGAIGISADFAQDWLEPLPPVTTKPEQERIAA
jgi:hypothetical protein